MSNSSASLIDGDWLTGPVSPRASFYTRRALEAFDEFLQWSACDSDSDRGLDLAQVRETVETVFPHETNTNGTPRAARLTLKGTYWEMFVAAYRDLDIEDTFRSPWIFPLLDCVSVLGGTGGRRKRDTVPPHVTYRLVALAAVLGRREAARGNAEGVLAAYHGFRDHHAEFVSTFAGSVAGTAGNADKTRRAEAIEAQVLEWLRERILAAFDKPDENEYNQFCDLVGAPKGTRTRRRWVKVVQRERATEESAQPKKPGVVPGRSSYAAKVKAQRTAALKAAGDVHKSPFKD